MHEGELGGPFYRQPEAVVVNGNLRRVITAAQGSVRVIRTLSVIMEVHGSVLVLIELEFGALGVSSTERGGAGPSAAGSASRTCRPRWRCHGRALARMRPRGEQRGIGRRRTALSRRSVPCRPPWEVPTPQKTPARAGQRATDARKRPSARVVLQTVGRGSEERAKCTVNA